jgi:hypothetical protein
VKRKYNLRKLNRHKSYDSSQLQELLGVHKQTIKTWKKEGLKPIDGGCSPYLYSGSVLIDFLAKRTNSQKLKLHDDEMYCLKCNKAVKPLELKTIQTGKILGSGNESIAITGICPLCKGKVCKFSSIKRKVEVLEVKKEKQQFTLFD